MLSHYAGKLSRKSSLIKVAETTRIQYSTGKETRKCFTGSLYEGYRSDDFDRLLPVSQPETTACVITTLTGPEASFTDWAAAVLDVSTNTPVRTLSNLLKERDYVMTLVEVGNLVKRREHVLTRSLFVEGWGNYFFVKNKNGSLSVANVMKNINMRYPTWHGNIELFGDCDPGFEICRHFLIRNLKNASRFEFFD